MIDNCHELISFYVIFTFLLIINLYTQNNGQITILFLIILFILMMMQYRRAIKYLNQLKKYDEVALHIQQKKDWYNISPLVIEQQEVIGNEYNKLMRFIKKQECKNRRNMQVISIITNNTQDPLVILNINGELEYANNRFKEWVNMSALKKVLFQEVKNEDLRKILEDALICETTRKKQLEIGQKYYISKAHPIYDEREDFSGTVILFHDITDIKKYENLQKEFFGNVSHELKTPISAIKGCTEILLNGAKYDAQACDEFLMMIQAENNRMEQLVKDLLLVNRYEHDQIKQKTDRICLTELVENCMEQTLNIANLKHQKIKLESSEMYYIEGDYIKLQHCFLNLLTNAIHYSLEETTITIKMKRYGSSIKIQVIDQGIGIPTKDLPHIFERFYRVDKARSRHTGGTGLGLSIVSSIVEAHGGRIEVKSELNKGSNFIVTLSEKINLTH
ncbi:MAG: two-component sensor histidine kinase [Turicibacter sp.]|nr:two-component sensor histidine kinase [Turicibacter sp.]